jgi:hypothetical protein
MNSNTNTATQHDRSTELQENKVSDIPLFTKSHVINILINIWK